MIAICKRPATECALVFGDLQGVQVAINLMPGQRWHVAKDGKYFFIWQQKNIKLRLTKAAFNRLFEQGETNDNEK